MKNIFLFQRHHPFFGNNNNKSRIPSAHTNRFTDEVAKSIDHNKWNALLQKNVSRSGNAKLQSLSKIASNAHLMTYPANVPLNHGSRMLRLPIDSMHTLIQ
jgi:hypothetical protein